MPGAYRERCLRFRDAIPGQLEVAIGLETAHPDVLARLNKRMTLETFRRAAGFLREHDIALRVFVLLSPPFMPRGEGGGVGLPIARRGGRVRRERLLGDSDARRQRRDGSARRPFAAAAAARRSRPPSSTGSRSAGMRVFADLWDIERFFDCGCSPDRAARLAVMNREQRVPPASYVHVTRRSVRLQPDDHEEHEAHEGHEVLRQPPSVASQTVDVASRIVRAVRALRDLRGLRGL